MTNVESWLPDYRAVVRECLDISAVKLREYGVSWREYRTLTAVDNALIKACRIRELEELEASGETAKIDEGREAEYFGVLNYSAIALIIYRETTKGAHDALRTLDADRAQTLMNAAADEAEALMVRKTHDYGDAWRLMEISSITDTLIARCNRVKDLIRLGGKSTSEGADAQLLDMINYAAFAVLRIRKK